jgi:hypothetical protein
MVIVQPLQFSWAPRSRWIAISAVATMVWSIEAISSAIDTIGKTTHRRGDGSSPTGTCSSTTVVGPSLEGPVAAGRLWGSISSQSTLLASRQ